ncbi:hypothetical protein [Phaeovulum sp. NW3]|uniref:hypothetical protein n=1 Tax=Phaeovulum sp. NW3 TaxID=2934933 RepID=UPI002020C749|nr:hypothetical protein [Phaeovulum sp. NW3]MCL7465099.1 hypothetical protein [Phaeovulum sp. NW3]
MQVVPIPRQQRLRSYHFKIFLQQLRRRGAKIDTQIIVPWGGSDSNVIAFRTPVDLQDDDFELLEAR